MASEHGADQPRASSLSYSAYNWLASCKTGFVCGIQSGFVAEVYK